MSPELGCASSTLASRGNLLKVLTIGHSYAVAGNRAVMRELARDPEFEITLAAPASHAGDLRTVQCEPEPVSSKLKLVGLPARWTTRIHIFHYAHIQLKELVRSEKFDIIHSWEEPYILAGYQIALASAGLPAQFCFVTCQNLPKKYLPPFSYFEKSVLRRSQGWIAIGRTVLDNLIARGYPAHRGRVLSLAVDPLAFAPKTQEDSTDVRRRLNLAGPVIGFVGRFVPGKGLRVLMQALERLNSSTDWSLLLLGSGPMEREIHSWAVGRGWSGRVRTLLVRHDEVGEYLRAMDLLVAPSQTTPNWREQFGRMLVEALACGVPVIASDSGEIPHVIGNAGAIVHEGDVQQWSHEIERCLRNRELRRMMAAAGQERARLFSVEELARSHKKYFREIAGATTGCQAIEGGARA
jgi:phosphatidylinositol alpha-1,6-mannosyltransferase